MRWAWNATSGQERRESLARRAQPAQSPPSNPDPADDVVAFGSAAFHGSTGNLELAASVVDLAPTPSGNGYWEVTANGSVHPFGDAVDHGSTASTTLAAPVVAIMPTTSGGGYWIVASDGGVFSFGDAAFHGSAGNLPLAKPVVDAASGSVGGLMAAFASTLALTLTNPTTILSFVAVFAGLGIGTAAGDQASAVLMICGVFLGSALWWLLLSGAVGFFRRALTPERLRWVNRTSGALLAAFGVLALLSLRS